MRSGERAGEPAFDFISEAEYEEAYAKRVYEYQLEVARSYLYYARIKGLAGKAILASAAVELLDLNIHDYSPATLVLQDQDLQNVTPHTYQGVMVNSFWTPHSQHPLIVQRGILRARVIEGFFVEDKEGGEAIEHEMAHVDIRDSVLQTS